MSVIVILIMVSLFLAIGFLLCFIWAVRSGQYEDTLTPSMRILPEDTIPRRHKHSDLILSNKVQPPT